MSLSVVKFNAIKPRSIAASRSKAGGSFQLVPGNPLPKIEWSQLVSGVEQITEVAQLQGLELVISPEHKQAWIKLKHQHEVNITADKLAAWVGKQTEKYSLAYLADNGLISSLEDAAKDYFKGLVTTASIDLEDNTTLQSLAVSTMLQCTRQAALLGTNAKLSKMIADIPEDVQVKFEAKLLEAIAELKLLPASEPQEELPQLPISNEVLEPVKPQISEMTSEDAAILLGLLMAQDSQSVKQRIKELSAKELKLVCANASQFPIEDVSKAKRKDLETSLMSWLSPTKEAASHV